MDPPVSFYKLEHTPANGEKLCNPIVIPDIK
jgi:hypothetical protein